MATKVTLVCVLLATMVTGYAQAQTELVPYVNVLANASFETDGAAEDELTIVAPPEWQVTGNATQVRFGAGGLFPAAPGATGQHFLAGGPGSGVSTVTQQFVVTETYGLQHDIDIGLAGFELVAWLGGATTEADYSVCELRFADAMGATLAVFTLGPVTAADRGGQTCLLPRGIWGMVPIGTRLVEYRVTMTRVDGTYNNGYCDETGFVVIVADQVQPTKWGALKALHR
jgi:hypothetical protein